MSEIPPLRPDPLGEGFAVAAPDDVDDETTSRIRAALIGTGGDQVAAAHGHGESARGRLTGRPDRHDGGSSRRERVPAARSPWTGRRQGRVTLSGVGTNVVVLLGIAAVAPIVFALVSYVSSRSSGGDQGRAPRDGLVVDRVKARTKSPVVPSLPVRATSVRVELYGHARAAGVTLHRDDTAATMEHVALPYAALVSLPPGVQSVGLEASSAKASPAEPLQCRIYVADALVALNTGVDHVTCDVTAASLPTR